MEAFRRKQESNRERRVNAALIHIAEVANHGHFG
jgi:hypothetical protein